MTSAAAAFLLALAAGALGLILAVRLTVRWLARFVLAGMALLLGYFCVTFVQVWIDSHRNDPVTAQAIVVLGAAQYNGKPSPALEARLAHALGLWKRGLAPLVVVTGGRQPGDRFTEATAGYDYLRARGVPDAAILMEVQGASTYESLAAASRFLHARRIERVLLVSDDYHNARLLAISSEVHLQGHVSPAPDHRSTGAQLHQLGRETVAVALGRIVGFRRLDNR